MIGRIFDENRKELIASEESLLEDETLLSLTAGPFTINRHIPVFRTQVILTTHSPQFLDSFGDSRPTTTVAKWVDGETVLKTVDGKELEYWSKLEL